MEQSQGPASEANGEEGYTLDPPQNRRLVGPLRSSPQCMFSASPGFLPWKMLTLPFTGRYVPPEPVLLAINVRSVATSLHAACLVRTAPTTRLSVSLMCRGLGSGSIAGEEGGLVYIATVFRVGIDSIHLLSPSSPTIADTANREDSSSSPSERGNATTCATYSPESSRGRSPSRSLWTSMLPPDIHDSLPQSEYLGESLGLFMLQSERRNMDIYHPLSWGSISAPSGLDPVQVSMLNQQGAFMLPYQELCDELIDDFFKWVAPVLPVVNRTMFMAQYKGMDQAAHPSLLLLQSMLLAASKVSRSSRLVQATGSNAAASALFYKRAKSLYDAGYETDRIVILQSVILMGWYCEDPRGVGTTFYWSRIAIALAQSVGIHRSVTTSALSLPDKRLYKRIWWTLFTRDRLLSVCLGRPMAINLADCDVEPLQDKDFDETEDGPRVGYRSNPIFIAYFTQYVKLSIIMGEIFATYYSATSKIATKNASEAHLQYDQRLTEWLQQRPPEMVWGKGPHEFWAAILHLHYCTAICLLHRARMPAGTETSLSNNSTANRGVHLSREAAYDAASCITDIVETLMSCTELNYAPPFIIYSLYSALLVHVHRIHKTRSSNLFPATSRGGVCLCALLELSTTWTVAHLVYTMFCHLLTSDLKKWESNTNSRDPNNQTGQQPDLTEIMPHMRAVEQVSFSSIDPSLVATGTFDLQTMGLLPVENGGFAL
ncbi:fungal-specific transcription factor domain-containing protein [Aspergillus heterothallicus]